MSLFVKSKAKKKKNSLLRTRLFSRSNPLVGYFVYPHTAPDYSSHLTAESNHTAKSSSHAAVSSDRLKVQSKKAGGQKLKKKEVTAKKQRRWFARGRCSRTHRERVLNRKDPYVGYFAHSKSRNPFALDPALQFLSDCEGSVGTPSCCGSDFDYDDVELEGAALSAGERSRK